MSLSLIHWGSLLAIAIVALYPLRYLFIRGPFHNVRGPTSPSLFTGNLGQVFSTKGWIFHSNLLEEYGSVAKISAFFGEQRLLVSDPLALYHIAIKEQPIYEELNYFYSMNYLLWGEGLVAMQGELHKKQRKMLSPVFSTKHLRDIVPIFLEVVYELRAVMISKVERGENEIEMLDWLTRTALELIGRAGLGYNFRIMQEGSIDEYGSAVKSLLPTVFGVFTFIQALPHLMKIGSPGFRRSVIDRIPNRDVQAVKEMVDIMAKTSERIYQEKVTALRDGDEALAKMVGGGKDLMSLLLSENMKASEEDRLPESQVLGQMSMLIFAAMDTTSSALSRILYMLASNPKEQERLRKEIHEAHGLGEFSYDTLDRLPYMEAVIRETLRLHPPVNLLQRRTLKDTILPLSLPVKGNDGSTITEIPIPRGTNMVVSILAMNRNKAIWGEDAYEWKPDRWLSPLPTTIIESKIPSVYSNIMSFWGGPRGCIGFKFSLLETKVVLAVLLESFKFELPETKITWDMAIITVPRPEGMDSKSPCLPMKVSLLEESSSREVKA